MEFDFIESQASTSHDTFMYDTIYFQGAGDDDEGMESQLEDDEEDEDFDDRAADLDDLNSVRVDDDLNEPDAESKYDITNPDPDADHLPEEEDF
ncbi:hypothetical protein [Mucilaginibacter antarcticus]|uniref:Uncharacterized protein n=1 Tax=Mucilaginibacter antarcticus TaxID=1855725 RepID=A0ABW5XTR6_9SPHI